jgi:hypothetical protein
MLAQLHDLRFRLRRFRQQKHQNTIQITVDLPCLFTDGRKDGVSAKNLLARNRGLRAYLPPILLALQASTGYCERLVIRLSARANRVFSLV